MLSQLDLDIRNTIRIFASKKENNMLKPLFKYTGGKYSEYKFFKKYIPDYIENYYEPFAGSAGVYLQLKNEGRIHGQSVLNDKSEDLVGFYRLIGDNTLKNILHQLNSDWLLMRRVSKNLTETIGEKFLDAIEGRKEIPDKRFINGILSCLMYFVGCSSEIIVANIDSFVDSLSDSVIDKAKRFAKKNIKEEKERIVNDCISTAIHSGFYMFLRDIYNKSKDRTPEYYAIWFFVRELCFGSMFRFGKDGKFNVPYGGHSYDSKDLKSKIDSIFKDETIQAFSEEAIIKAEDFSTILDMDFGKDDFIFLDPPYDTTFSEYDNIPFGKEDHVRLAEKLKNLNAKWMLVIKETPLITELYSGWANIFSFEKTYKYKARGEYDSTVWHLIITNY